MATRFKVGDTVENMDGTVSYEITKTGEKHPRGGPAYGVKVLKSRNPRRVGVHDVKPLAMIDREYRTVMVSPPAFGGIQFSNIDIDQTMIDTLRAQFKQATEVKCDCGAHKCGYSNEEVHGHARWCEVVKRAFRTPIFNEEA